MLNTIIENLKVLQIKISENLNKILVLEAENTDLRQQIEELKANDKSTLVEQLQGKVADYEVFVKELQTEVDALKKLLEID